jgi:hypothetical protein
VTRLLAARQLIQAALTVGTGPSATGLRIGDAGNLAQSTSMAGLSIADRRVQAAALRDQADPRRGRALRAAHLQLGPDYLIVDAQVSFSDELSADKGRGPSPTIDRRLAEQLPLVPHVFIDPTQDPG